jgi:hypothetical protein
MASQFEIVFSWELNGTSALFPKNIRWYEKNHPTFTEKMAGLFYIHPLRLTKEFPAGVKENSCTSLKGARRKKKLLTPLRFFTRRNTMEKTFLPVETTPTKHGRKPSSASARSIKTQILFK